MSFHFAVLTLILTAFTVSLCAEQKITKSDAGEIRIFKRLIPADVLRGKYGNHQI